MDYSKSFAISAAGMAVERMRVDAAALNLANASTIRTADGASYEPVRVVARTGDVTASAATFGALVDEALEGDALAGVGLPGGIVEPTGAPPRMVYEPGSPFADAKGFVAYPAVDPATEMVTLMRALRAYEANVAAMNATRTLALKSLDIGSGS